MSTMRLGEEGFRWFLAVVESTDDPLKLGRIKIRILNEQDYDEVSTDDLVFAQVMMPITSASLGGVGLSPTGILVGSRVIGFFVDTEEENMPVILGTWHTKNKNVHDVNELAREKQILDKEITKGTVVTEPDSAYNSKYPNNKTMTTPSGHAIEIDDTPGEERIHLYHKSGTYVEINKDGRTVVKNNDDVYEIDAKNKIVLVKGNVTLEVNGNIEEHVDGDYNIDVKGNYNVTSGKNMKLEAKRIDLNP